MTGNKNARIAADQAKSWSAVTTFAKGKAIASTATESIFALPAKAAATHN